MGTTSRGYRYPEGVDPTNVVGDIRNLALDVNNDLGAYIAGLAAPRTEDTPIWQTGGTNLSIGNGTIFRRWKQQGRLVLAYFQLTRGSTTNFGSGSYAFGLPIQARGYREVLGSAMITPSAGGTYPAVVFGTGTGIVGLTYTSNNTRVGSAGSPGGGWAAGDVIAFSVAYEGA